MPTIVPTLRRAHLCLGCFFAPMLVFFTLSGLWQMQHPHGLNGSWAGGYLSTIHTGHRLKSETVPTLSSPTLRGFIVLMALSLLLNVALGLMLAWRSPHRHAAAWSVFAGATSPAALVILPLWRAAQFH